MIRRLCGRLRRIVEIPAENTEDADFRKKNPKILLVGIFLLSSIQGVRTVEKRIFIPRQPLLTEVTDSYYRKPSALPEIGLFYTFDAAHQHRIPLFFPDDTIDIMFSSREDGGDPHIGIYGQRLSPGTLDIIHPNYRYFGVRLSPGSVSYTHLTLPTT